VFSSLFLLDHVVNICVYIPDNVGDDCPVFDGLFEYCSISAGGSMGRVAYLRPSTLAQINPELQRAPPDSAVTNAILR